MARTKKTAQIGAIEGEVMPPTPDRIQLHSIEHTLREARRVYRLMASGRLDMNTGGKLIWSLQAITTMTKDAILERRLDELERLTTGEQLDPQLLEYEGTKDE